MPCRSSLDSLENYGTMTLHIRFYQDIIIVIIVIVVDVESGEGIIAHHHEYKNFSSFCFCCVLFFSVCEWMRWHAEGFEVGKKLIKKIALNRFMFFRCFWSLLVSSTPPDTRQPIDDENLASARKAINKFSFSLLQSLQTSISNKSRQLSLFSFDNIFNLMTEHAAFRYRPRMTCDNIEIVGKLIETNKAH